MKFLATAAIANFVFATTVPRVPDAADYRLLYDLLKKHISDESDNQPHWLRSSFHDLANFGANLNGKGGGPHGCMKDDPVRSMSQNAQLDDHIRKLNLLINEHLPHIAYPFGDVISLAGKVAVEDAFPCIRIKWRPGRPPCGPEVEAAPDAGFQTYGEFQGHLNRYKFSRKEFAVLIAGAHGIKEAKLHLLQKELPWVGRDSGVDFIRDSLNDLWVAAPGNKLDLQTPMPHVYLNHKNYIRLPSDMLFFPTSVQRSKAKYPLASIQVNPEAKAEEDFLRSLITDNQLKFNNTFADVYSKMLEIGVNPAEMGPWFNNKPDPHLESPRKVCPYGWYQAQIANIP